MVGDICKEPVCTKAFLFISDDKVVPKPNFKKISRDSMVAHQWSKHFIISSKLYLGYPCMWAFSHQSCRVCYYLCTSGETYSFKVDSCRQFEKLFITVFVSSRSFNKKFSGVKQPKGYIFTFLCALWLPKPTHYLQGNCN